MKFNFLTHKTDSKPLIITVWLIILFLSLIFWGDNALRNRKIPPHPYVKASAEIQNRLRQSNKKYKGRLFIFFIDAFRFDYAINPELMPYLNSIKNKGTWGKVTPCLSNMTVHCVEAAFSGIDRSSILSLSEDFHPKESENTSAWLFKMHKRGYRISAVSDYVIPTLYKKALYKSYVYKKGTSQTELTAKALEFFKNSDVTILHLLGAHDLGQTYGTTGKEYKDMLAEDDKLLKAVDKQMKPEDTLLVFGDHGINDEGLHTYNTDTPTFYLYKGPFFKHGIRQDISILSHGFFLNTLYGLPFELTYQGDFYWNTLPDPAKKLYGDEKLRSLKRKTASAGYENKSEYKPVAVVFALASLFGLILLFSNLRKYPVYLHLLYFSFALLFSSLNSYVLPVVMLLYPAFIIKKTPEPKIWALILTLGIWAILKALIYRNFDVYVHYSKIQFVYLFYILETAAAYLFIKFLTEIKSFRETLIYAVSAAAFISFFTLYPTLYFYGLIRSVPFWLMAVSSVLFVFSKDFRQKNVFAFVIFFTLLILTATQISMFVENFRIFFFKYAPKNINAVHLAWMITPYVFLTYFLNKFYNLKTGVSIFNYVYAVLLAGLFVVHPPDLLFAVLLPVIAVVLFIPPRVFKRFVPKSMLLYWIILPELIYMHGYGMPVFYRLGVLSFITAFIFKYASEYKKPDFAAVPLIFVFIMAIVAGFGFRTCGIDFKFAVRWFPKLFEKYWILVTVMSFFKYALGVLLVLVPMYAFERKFVGAAVLTAVRLLSAVLFFAAVYLVTLIIYENHITLVIDSFEEFMYLLGTFIFLVFSYFYKTCPTPDPAD